MCTYTLFGECWHTLYTAAHFLYKAALCPHLSPSSPSSILHLYFLLLLSSSFSHSSPSWGCVHVCVFWYVCVHVWMTVWFCSVCMRVIIAMPPRGNQHWSLDSPDPLMLQHTCPWGAVPPSSEPVWMYVCGWTICWWRWSGHVASSAGDLHTHSTEEAPRMGHKKMTNKHKRWTPRDK